MNESTFESELRYTFLAETSEMLDDAENIFMHLESSPKDLSNMPKLLRIMHTVKGSGTTVGYTEIGNFTHKFETLLVAIRDKKIDTSEEIIDLLLASNDCLKKCITILQKNLKSKLVHLDEIEKKIDSVLSEKLNTKVEKINQDSFDDIRKNDKKSVVNQTTNSQNSKGNILICDDDEELLETVSEMLQMENYYVTACNKAETALEILKTQNFDIIFTDLKMPGMDGLEFTKKIRNINIYIPIIFISGNISREHVKKFLRLGVSDFIDKPFTSDALLLVAERAMRTAHFWKELLTISKSCFKIFVFIQKVDALLSDKHKNILLSGEREILKECLAEIQKTTSRLLAVEKDAQSSFLKVSADDR
ncbi:response regulator [Fluviispira vulneris]|uniref:response regulator n=1 Tax=Fluviispira vulneris TaxID=2763012 RepID=UPI0016452B84|nr:response regulator [Fluviispira vulneris]